MLRIRCVIAGAGLALALTAGSAAAADLSAATAWVGKYASDTVRGHTFFTHPAISAARRRTVGPYVYRRLQQITGPEVPVLRIGHYVAAWYCQQHDCGDRNTTTILRLDKGDAVVCLHESGGSAARWYIPRHGRVSRVDEQGACPSDNAGIRAAIRRLGL
jgi:hypothetical protein